MGFEAAPIDGEGSCSSSASVPISAASCSPNGKRNRDANEDEIYLDNFHSHKRYLSEIMACSLNGLSVGETLTENPMESPARSDSSVCYNSRDELAPQYSPMSEDFEDTRFYESPYSLLTSQLDGVNSLGNPLSPQRCLRHQMASFSSTSWSHGRRVPDAEPRFPSSPNDVCHTGDLRRTALLRSVQMRAQPHGSPSADELLFGGMAGAEEGDGHFPCLKNGDDEPE